jgi:glycosyltransferase involved in cell wall biosynthesis
MLTIVTITRNDGLGLRRTLDSYAHWCGDEVDGVVVDGGEDNGLAVAKIVGARPLAVVQREARGIADAMNAGLREARGEWVWFVNGGDAVHEELSPDWLLELLRKTRADVVVGAVHFDDEAVPRKLPPLERQWPLTVCWLPHPSTIVRRELLNQVGGFDERWRIAMDFDLWHRLLVGGTVVDVISTPFARFDINGVSQRRETRSTLIGEESAILRSYAWPLLKGGFVGLGRVLYRLARIVCRRVGSPWRRL